MSIQIRGKSLQGGFFLELFPLVGRPYFHAVEDADDKDFAVYAHFFAQLFSQAYPALLVGNDVEGFREKEPDIVLIALFCEVPGFEVFVEFEEDRERENVKVGIGFDYVQFVDAFGVEDLAEPGGNDESIFLVERIFIISREQKHREESPLFTT
jgi:hypothetical protein